MKVIISGTEHTIPAKTTNKSLTSLSLMGDDAYNYGSSLLENLIHLNEHFYNADEPSIGIDGQIYYDGTNLKLYHTNKWHIIDDLILKESLDVIYLDNNQNNISGALIDTFLSTLMPMAGNSNNISNIILPDSDPSNAYEAVTKKYVDNILDYPNLFNLVPRSGSPSMSGQIKLSEIDTSDSDLVTASVQYVKDMGLLDIYSDNSKPEKYRISTYKIVDKLDESNINYKDYFTTVWYQETIPAGQKSVKINLPVEFVAATTKDIDYDYSMIVNCSPVDTFDILSVEINSGKSFTVYRQEDAADLMVQGSVMGFTNKDGRGKPYDIYPDPTPSLSPSPLPVPVVPEASPEPAATPSPSPSPAGTPNPTPSPGVTPTPAPTPSAALTTQICIDSSSATNNPYYSQYKILTPNMGNITVTYNPLADPDTFEIKKGSSPLASTNGAVSSQGTLTAASSGLVANDLIYVIVSTGGSLDVNWNYCINYAGGLQKIS